MAKDPTPSQVATNALQSLPFDNIIGGPLKACIQAQQLEKIAAEFMKEAEVKEQLNP